MEKSKLKVELRNDTGKEVNKKFRREGIVPGVLYSPHDEKNLLLKVKREGLLKLLSGKKHGIIDLEINDGEKNINRLAIIKDFQYNSLKKQMVHVDFYGVTLKEKLTVQVGIELIGEPIGVEEGGILEVELREVEIECLPSQVPESLKADISHLKINDHLTVSELDIPKGIEVLTEPDRIIASVHPPTKIEEVVKEEEEEVEEVEEVAEEEKAKVEAEAPSSEPKKEREEK
ncbi:MAG: 50S ribosomal protein L25 [Candidatus Atribacteria bacterium]